MNEKESWNLYVSECEIFFASEWGKKKKKKQHLRFYSLPLLSVSGIYSHCCWKRNAEKFNLTGLFYICDLNNQWDREGNLKRTSLYICFRCAATGNIKPLKSIWAKIGTQIALHLQAGALHLSLQSTCSLQSRGRRERVFCSAVVTQRVMDAGQRSFAKAMGC